MTGWSHSSIFSVYVVFFPRVKNDDIQPEFTSRVMVSFFLSKCRSDIELYHSDMSTHPESISVWFIPTSSVILCFLYPGKRCDAELINISAVMDMSAILPTMPIKRSIVSEKGFFSSGFPLFLYAYSVRHTPIIRNIHPHRICDRIMSVFISVTHLPIEKRKRVHIHMRMRFIQIRK